MIPYVFDPRKFRQFYCEVAPTAKDIQGERFGTEAMTVEDWRELFKRIREHVANCNDVRCRGSRAAG